MDRLVASCLSREPNNNGTYCCQSTVPRPGQSLVYLEIGVTRALCLGLPGEKQKTSLSGKWTSLTRPWMLSSAYDTLGCYDHRKRGRAVRAEYKSERVATHVRHLNSAPITGYHSYRQDDFYY